MYNDAFFLSFFICFVEKNSFSFKNFEAMGEFSHACTVQLSVVEHCKNGTKFFLRVCAYIKAL